MTKQTNKWLVVLAVLTGTFTVVLNNSMLNPVLPKFQEIFNTDAVGTGWILTIFMIAMGMLMPLTGYLGDRFGKKKVYIAGLILFVFGSVMGALSSTLSLVIIARAVQGIAGGLMMPNAMALIFQVFPKNERGFAVGIYGIAVMIAPAIGPTLGGIISIHFDWFYLFLINIPFAILSLIFSIKYLVTTEPNRSVKFDTIGFILVTIGIGSLLYVLGQGRDIEHFANFTNISLIIIGIIALIIFIKYEVKQEQPLLNLSVFKIKTFRYSMYVTVAASIGLFSALFLLPYLLQDVYGYSEIETGLIFLPSAIASGIFMTIGGKILDVKGPKYVVPIGILIITVASVLFGFVNITTGFWILLIINTLHGFGLGFGNMPATTAGMNAIPEHLVAQGSAMNNLIRQIASSVAIVFFSIYFELRRGQMMLNESISYQEASLQAINESFIISGVLVIISIPFAYKMKGVEEERS